jgi:hypothetical protein
LNQNVGRSNGDVYPKALQATCTRPTSLRGGSGGRSDDTPGTARYAPSDLHRVAERPDLTVGQIQISGGIEFSFSKTGFRRNFRKTSFKLLFS